MNRPTTLPMLGSNNAGQEAYERWHEALRRLSKDSTMPPLKQTLGTKYAAEFEESSDLPDWADEIDTERRRDSWVGKQIVILALTCGVLGFMAWAFNIFLP